MAGPYPLTTLAAQITAAGISAPNYADILASLQASYRAIYGADVYLEPDSQDGQLLAIFAASINDCNATAIAVYNAFSPSTAQGAGLSSVVKINGLARLVATNSTADLTIVGEAGTTINNGIVSDGFGNQWLLPASFSIPPGGLTIQTATAASVGDLAALPNTINQISTPTRGWQSATNVSAATPGAPVESDATLRKRQAASTAISAVAVLPSIVAAVANLDGILRYRAYENDTNTTNADGIPSHSISLVVEGGDAVEIATAIALKKTPGTGTYGTTSEVITDSRGVPNTIRFFRPTIKRVVVAITANALTGYVSTTGDAIKQAVRDYVNSLPIGDDVYYTKIIGAADLPNPLGATYNIATVQISFFGGSPGTGNLVVAFNEAASLAAIDITLAVS